VTVRGLALKPVGRNHYRYGAIFLTIGGAFVPGSTLPAWTSGNVVVSLGNSQTVDDGTAADGPSPGSPAQSDSARAAAIGLVAMFGNWSVSLVPSSHVVI
jgi:hypothetical protein